MQSLSGFLRKIFRSTRPVKDRGSDPEISGNNDVYSVPNPPVATDPWTRRPRPPPPPFPQPSTPTDDYISDVGQVRSAGPLTERAPPPLPPPPPPPFPQPSSPTNDSISDAEQVQSEPELRTHNPDDGNAQARNQPDRYRQATSSSSPTAAIARHDTFASKLSSVDTLPSYRSRPTSLAASLPAYRLSSVVRAQPPLPSLPSLYRFSGLETTVLGASESGRDAGEMS
ncbi:hypothetical protein D9758_006911 [Tetrapyrgos nigripes]|uniref:Uncharacterized protein n=1 Tax=Tetrapyrgos nigripes TaxID=182062 RepID=A0A8H5GSF4_9AGAR|nr:hypothetical protein D9758_006911 [Tetrapyrgos nigripes]